MLLLASLAGVASAAERGAAETLLVRVSNGDAATAVARDAGAVLEARAGDLAIILANPAAAKALARDARVLDIERDGTVHATSASWDSASWDSASWDSASWDSASWDSASWDSASWDSASWDASSWDSASWDASSWDSASWDSASWDASSWDSASWDSASWDLVVYEDGRVPPWGLFAIHAPSRWQGTPAHAKLVCVVDSGIDTSHPGLAPNLWTGANGEHGWDAITGSSTLTDPAGHGTHVAGIVAAARDQPWPGVSQALIAGVRVLNADGLGTTSDVIAALGWCGEHDADIILLALTEDAPTRAFEAAIADAQRGGALIVAAAGNIGPCDRCASSPADLPRVLGVGAASPNGLPAAFSATGKDVDLFAPGDHITSTAPGGYRTASGTSQAAAFAAGAAALMWSRCADATAEQIAHALTPNARGQTPLLDLATFRLASCEVI